jgi:ribosomal peptide maturation radical SAM protein 1
MLGEVLFCERPGALEESFGGRDTIPVFGGEALGISLPFARQRREHVAPFVDLTVARILALRPKIVGFSTMFQQTVPAHALALAVKRAAPEVVTVVGGPNVAEPMGSALLEVAPGFDVGFSGEADEAFPAFCEAILRGEPAGERRVVACEMVRDLDRAAIPDYTDLFEELLDLGPDFADLPRWLHVEASRGCWYGAKHHCTFCGLNGLDMAYRHKSPARILAELDHLARTTGVERLRATDNILPIPYVREVLPRLASRTPKLDLAWEIRANQRPADLDALVAAGVREVQPGIESFSTAVLTRMRKGTTALQNLWMLREGLARGLRVFWNLLVSVPGDTMADYEGQLALFPILEHLPPPAEWGPIGVNRFSPYHEHPEHYGLRDLRPFPVYRRLWGEKARCDALGYFFDAEWDSPWRTDPELRARVDAVCGAWQRRHDEPSPPVLEGLRLSGGGIVVRDTRTVATQALHLLAPEAVRALDAVDRPVPDDRVDGPLRSELERLERNRLVVHYEGRWLSVVVFRRGEAGATTSST